MYSGVDRIINPVKINYNGMIIFAIFGVIVNFLAAYFTRDGDSINQKSVNLHMLEDVLGWVVVLIGSILMRFSDISIIDPIMSICVALFILFNAFRNFKEILDLFLEKIPNGVSIDELTEHIKKIKGVIDVHHIHVWSIDGNANYSTMHVVALGDIKNIKNKIREEMEEHGIVHTTIEIEEDIDECSSVECNVSSELLLYLGSNCFKSLNISSSTLSSISLRLKIILLPNASVFSLKSFLCILTNLWYNSLSDGIYLSSYVSLICSKL